MSFHAFFFGMPVPARDEYAQKAGTSRAVLTQVAYGNKSIELGFGDVLCALSAGAVTLDDLPLTANAQRQRAIREDHAPHPAGRPCIDVAEPAPQEARDAA